MEGLDIKRRFLLAGLASIAGAGPVLAREVSGTKLVLLGTAGGPTPKRNRAAPSQAIIVDGRVYIVDCGNGVARQIASAGLPLAQHLNTGLGQRVHS